MSIGIHYRGTLTDKKQIELFVNELEDIAKSVNWHYHILDGDWSKTPNAKKQQNSAGELEVIGNTGLKGIVIKMSEQHESLTLCFDAAGQLVTPQQIAQRAALGYMGKKGWISVETHPAGADIHVAMIRLLRYLSRKYLHDLEVKDDGGYWQSGDYRALVERMNTKNPETKIAVPEGDADANEKDIVDQIEEALRKIKDRENRGEERDI